MNYKAILNLYYRKYLNREPDIEGFSYYLSLLRDGKLDKKTLEEKFTNSLEYKSKQLELKYKKSSKIKIQIHKKNFLVNLDENSFFWAQLQLGIWEPTTFDIFDIFLDKNHTYIDLGSWIGPTVLYGSQISKFCYAIEPDPVAYNTLEKNLELNPKIHSKVKLSNECMSNSQQFVYLTPKTKAGDSMSNILSEKSSLSWKIKTLTFNDYISKNSISDCNFIKMDIEGAEFLVLPTMNSFIKKEKPSIHLSLHPPLSNNPYSSMKKISKVAKLYDYIYDNNLRLLDDSYLLNELLFTKYFDIVLTDTKL